MSSLQISLLVSEFSRFFFAFQSFSNFYCQRDSHVASVILAGIIKTTTIITTAIWHFKNFSQVILKLQSGCTNKYFYGQETKTSTSVCMDVSVCDIFLGKK